MKPVISITNCLEIVILIVNAMILSLNVQLRTGCCITFTMVHKKNKRSIH